MKTILAILFIVVTALSLGSCTAQKGCHMNKGYVGYGK